MANRGLRTGVRCLVGELGNAIGDELEANDASVRVICHITWGKTDRRTEGSCFAAYSSLLPSLPPLRSYYQVWLCYFDVQGFRLPTEWRRGRVVGQQARRTRARHCLACQHRPSKSPEAET